MKLVCHIHLKFSIKLPLKIFVPTERNHVDWPAICAILVIRTSPYSCGLRYPFFSHIAPDDEAAPGAEFFVVAFDLFVVADLAVTTRLTVFVV